MAITDFTWDGFLFSNPDSAFQLAEIQYQFAIQHNQPKFLSGALNIKGISRAVVGKYDQALSFFEENLDLAIELDDKSTQAKMANNLAIIYRDKGDFEKSDLYFRKALKVFNAEKNLLGQSKTCNNLGISNMNQGNYGQAFEYFDKAKNISEELNNYKEKAASYNNLGNLHKQQGNYEEAINYYNKCLTLAIENNLTREESSATNNIGSIYRVRGEYDTALVWLTKSLELKKQTDNIQGESTVYINMGATLLDKGDYTQALSYFQKSLAIEEELEEEQGIALVLANIGSTYGHIGRSLQLNNPDSAKVLFTLTKEYSQKALDIAQRIGANSPLQIGFKTLFKLNYNDNQLHDAFSNINDITHHRDRGLKYNFFTLSERDKEIYFGTMVKDYELMYDFALQHQDTLPNAVDTVLNYVLKNKAITLKSSTAMRQKILNSSDSTLISSYQSWIVLKKKIAKGGFSPEELEKVQQEAQQQEKALNRDSKEFRFFESLEKMNWKDVQSQLKPKEAAIEFIHFESVLTGDTSIIYAALVVTPQLAHPQYIQLCSETEMATLFQSISGDNLSVVKQLYGSKDNLNGKLYNLVWKPLEKALEGSKTIFLSPSGLLHKISFSALAKNKNTYLCQHHELNNLGSTSQLIDYAANTNILQDNTYLIGGVDYNTDSTKHKVWPYLPSTLTESQTIHTQLDKKGYPVTQLTGMDANEASIKDICAKAGILHLSSHGFFFANPEIAKAEIQANEFYQEEVFFRGASDEELQQLRSANVYAQWSFVDNQNPLMRSGIVLAGGNDVWQRSALAQGEDGILTAAEVANIDMHNTNLVVLSACESGLGDIKGSEGVYGLQRSFKMAGVQHLITSLWQVPDKETAEFMTLFYKYLSKTKQIKTSFLKAQKVMRKKYDPYFWSAFVLME